MTDFKASLNHSLTEKISLLKTSLDLAQLEIGPLRTPLTIDFYEKWLSQNFHGEMAYLKNHLEYKKNPRLIEPRLNSVISIAQSYFPAIKPVSQSLPARIALYAQNEDYHYWLKEKLNSIIAQLKVDHPNEIFLPYVDSGPLLERDLAFQNKLGWFGKNTCLIHPQHGSLFFIAEILTSLETPDQTQNFEPLPDHCGTCRKCIDICPTQALVEPRTLKADQCISYLTIESKTAPPIELRQKIGDWFFGCDLCQTICPWNEKVFRQRKIEKTEKISTQNLLDLTPEKRAELIHYFRFLLSSSHNKILKYHYGSALSRAGAKGLKRNALIVIANKKLTELKTDIETITNSELSELANWTLQELRK